MATVRNLLVIICLVVIGRNWYTGSSIVVDHTTVQSLAPIEKTSIRQNAKIANADGLRIISIAQKELGVRETTGKNDGIRVSEYLAAAGLKTGAPWCAAFVSWTYQQAGYPVPATGWSPALFPVSRLVKEPSAGVVMGIYFPDLKRIGHCGFVEKTRGNWVYSIEGNTNVAGSREGDGVYRRLRHQRTVYKYADWTTKS